MNLTKEQQDVVDYVKASKKEELILVDSVAGSGKTTLLRGIAQAISGQEGMYLAYNKAIATESKKKFPSNIDCRTTHSLAYKYAVIPMGLNVGFFGPKQVTNKIKYSNKVMLVEDIKEFCLSSYLTYEEYAKANGRVNQELANHYLNQMAIGTIDCSHDFYLKMFHMALAEGSINMEELELLMLDEAGDLNEVTLEIFKLLPARVKIAVGDPNQNIYGFNYTINCFEKLKGQGTTFKLSKSFRVPQSIAGPMQDFCRTYLNPNMNFEGTDVENSTIRTRGYISRTNGGLINKLIELNNDRVSYGLVRKASEIFKLPLMVAGLKYQGKIYDNAYKHIQDDVDDWHEDRSISRENPKVLGYLRKLYAEDLALVQAINLVTAHGASGIFSAYNEAKRHENTKQDLMLLTAHSSKGLEFDEVMLAPDMNTSIASIVEAIDNKLENEDIEDILDPIARESLNLYYVACTRALVQLRNAEYL